jgi:2-polyprenyl-6-methoxyphenol hydroxylase-like FAD-dependent oxidoreductase
MSKRDPDVLVVGAGPTGLTLAGQLATFGSTIRVIDRGADRVHESRALAVQPRSLEVLRGLGVADELVELGRTAVQLELRADGHRERLRLFDIGLKDTAYPFLLFLSQAETERVLNEALAAGGVAVERRTELISFEPQDDDVVCTLRRGGGETELVRPRFLVGCDGAGSSVRRLARIPFVGRPYAPMFVLADVEADGDLDPDVAHAYLGRRGVLLFFPLGHPTSWRVIGRVPSDDAERDGSTGVRLTDVQSLVDSYTGGAVRLRDPAWMTRFGLQHRQATRYRVGRVFLAGDAAHVHSPAGAQGMNTGIQDAWNVGWKLALVSSNRADAGLLETYHLERWPVGRSVIRLSDRAFTAGTATHPVAGFIRTHIAPRALAVIGRVPWVRAAGFRMLAELGVRYRESPCSTEGSPSPRNGPRAGDRLPDARVERDRSPCWLQEALAAPTFHLLLCGPAEGWDDVEIDSIRERRAHVLTVHRLTRDERPGALHDVRGEAFARLGVERAAQYLVRPDGHVAFRSASTDLEQVGAYLDRWLPPQEPIANEA